MVNSRTVEQLFFHVSKAYLLSFLLIYIHNNNVIAIVYVFMNILSCNLYGISCCIMYNAKNFY